MHEPAADLELLIADLVHVGLSRQAQDRVLLTLLRALEHRAPGRREVRRQLRMRAARSLLDAGHPAHEVRRRLPALLGVSRQTANRVVQVVLNERRVRAFAFGG